MVGSRKQIIVAGSSICAAATCAIWKSSNASNITLEEPRKLMEEIKARTWTWMPKNKFNDDDVWSKLKMDMEKKKKIEMLKMEKVKKYLEGVEGRASGKLVSICIPSVWGKSFVVGMLQHEFEFNCANGGSVSAIVTAQKILESYSEGIPPKGLVLYAGTIVTDDGKEEEVAVHFEPYYPLFTFVYWNHTKFYTHTLHHQLLEPE